MSARAWDARTPDLVSSPQVALAGEVLDRLSLRGDELVLDGLGAPPTLDYVRLNIVARTRQAGEARRGSGAWRSL